ncbi:hypothetical protein [Microbacterium oleivorans]|uniref:hypothetical protein n=1 Tax=Microbacterium oleivorans TaxID=273677 RepID=UPI0011472191|nr:hypothetical protein [Microbacterium oleivorans]
MAGRTLLTIYLTPGEGNPLPPEPILVGNLYLVHSGLEQPSRLMGFSAPGQIPIALWAHEALSSPEKARGLYPHFIVRGRVRRHPLTVDTITVRDTSELVRVVITHTGSGKQYQPYVGDDRDRAQRIADAWGSNTHYTADVTPLRDQ